MEYRQDPTRIVRRRGWAVIVVSLVVVVGLGLVVGGAVLLEGHAHGVEAHRAADATATASTAPAPRRPPVITCHALGTASCHRVAQAALATVADPGAPAATHIDVWGSLLCGDALDCPPGRLADHRPAGSAIVAFATAKDVWVNVTEIDGAPRRAPDATRVPRPNPPQLEAWIIRAR